MPLQESDVVRIIRENVESKFPKTCGVCGKTYDSLAQFLRTCTHLSKPISYDGEKGNWSPEYPVGTFSLSTCECGNTLVISSTDMEDSVMLQLLEWAKRETEQRKIPLSDLLEHLRAEIDKQVLEQSV